MSFELNGKTYETDEEGYLINLGDWSEDVATFLAQQEKLDLTPNHPGADKADACYKPLNDSARRGCVRPRGPGCDNGRQRSTQRYQGVGPQAGRFVIKPTVHTDGGARCERENQSQGHIQ